jgi:Protein of unknown function (DUF3429)
MTMTLPPPARTLGLMGLLPQLAAVFEVATDGEWRWVALALGFGYAALIFSFIGGLWWGLALASERKAGWMFGAGVLPSLIALAAFAPWTLGMEWPGPSLILIGACLGISPLVDHAIARDIMLADGWLRLRWLLSGGLGVLTIALGLVAISSPMA